MKSLFNAADNQEMIRRVELLTAGSRPQWGKMGLDHMLIHAQRPLQVAFGELKLKRSIAGFLFGSWARKKIANGEEPFQKNLPTDKHFIVRNPDTVDEGKKRLISLIRRFAQGGPSAITREPHPFFGKMTTQEWDTLMWKHLDHHLRQFGV